MVPPRKLRRQQLDHLGRNVAQVRSGNGLGLAVPAQGRQQRFLGDQTELQEVGAQPTADHALHLQGLLQTLGPHPTFLDQK